MKRTAAATETLMRRTDDRLAERLRGRGWVVFSPETVAKIGISPVVLVDNADDGNALPAGARSCDAHGEHPHGGNACLDCPVCRPPLPCLPVCSDPAMHAEGGHDV